jgi:hypothetical protein|tara:strand:- start:3236 stop:4027 length:792 start_codon:yes stop_codon:yes gene_type:complete
LEHRVIKGKRHFVFENEEEHISHFLPDSPPQINPQWRSAEEGDWVKSDDGRIIQLLKVKSMITHPNDRKNYKYAKGWVRTVVGTFLNRENTFMDTDFSKHKNRYTFSGKRKNISKRIKDRKTLTRKERLFATSVATGKEVTDAYKQVFGHTTDNRAKAKAVVLLKQERVMKEIERGVMDIAKKLGIDHEYVLNNLKCLAENSVDENIQLQATKEMGKAIGTLGKPLTPKQEVGVYGMLQEFSTGQLDSVKRPELKEVNDLSKM